MKTSLFCLTLLLLSACAHDHTRDTHHHHASKKDDLPVHDHGSYVIRDGEEVLYFETEEAFLAHGRELRERKLKPRCGRKGRLFICEE